MNDKEFNSVVLAAFLHDIGKFMQRAEVDTTGIGGMKGRFGYEHSDYTYHFFDKPLISNWPDDFNHNLCRDLAGHHHNPQEPLQYIIRQADWLSAGMDRPEDNQKRGDKYKYLYSIFQNINLNGENKSELSKGYNLNVLNPDSECTYPVDVNGKTHNKDTYKKLWDQFLKDANKIEPHLPFRHFLSFMDSLLEQYTWCIPANTKEDYPYVSLYDHMKTTAAFAACLYKFHSETGSLDNEAAIMNQDEKKFLYIVADLSGIQNHIFNLSKEQSKGVSKILRARSFYLSVTTRAIIFSLLNDLGLPTVCNLQDSGGRFMILAPNTQLINEKLKKAQSDIEKWFFKKFYGDLTLNIAVSDGLSANDFKKENFQKNILQKVNEKINLAKKRKLSFALMTDNLWDEKKFIASNMKFPDREGEKICAITGKYPADEKTDFGSEKELYISEQCKAEWEIGKFLPDCKYLIYGTDSDTEYSFPILDGYPLEINLNFTKKVPQLYGNEILRAEKLNYTQENRNIPVYPTARTVPRGKNNEILSFEQIAEKSVDEETRLGSKMISVFKADVDNLGRIFSKGISKNFSLSRYITLSRMMNFFFTARIPAIIEKKYKNNIYTIFAGGDDLTLVGDWKSIMKFSTESYESFKDFTCRNNGITLSAGIATVHEKYPIRRAIEIAHEYLEESKSKKEPNQAKPAKNKITCFKTTAPWDKYKELIDKADKLDDELKKTNTEELSKGITMGLLYRLLHYHDMALKSKSKSDGCSSDMRELLWHSYLYYDVARNIKINKDDMNDKAKKENQELIDFIISLFNTENVEFLKIPLFTVLYKNRKPQQKETDNE